MRLECISKKYLKVKFSLIRYLISKLSMNQNAEWINVSGYYLNLFQILLKRDRSGSLISGFVF